MLQEGIIRLAINYHHLTSMILQMHPVAYLIEVFSSQAILGTEGFKGKSILVPPSAGVLHDVSHHVNVPLVNLHPGLYIAINLGRVKEFLIPCESMRRQLIFPAEV